MSEDGDGGVTPRAELMNPKRPQQCVISRTCSGNLGLPAVEALVKTQSHAGVYADAFMGGIRKWAKQCLVEL
jgi:hypothetical protein